MATLPEIPEWIAAIYQLEEDDLVKGGADGIDNLQAKQLAARTKYLKQQVESALSDMTVHLAAVDPHAQYAPESSPAFTGSPTAPTPAQFDADQSIANTEFVRRAAGSYRGCGSAPAVIGAADIGMVYQPLEGATVSFPKASGLGLPDGSAVTIVMGARTSATLATTGGASFYLDGQVVASLPIITGQTIQMVASGDGWWVFGHMKYDRLFFASVQANGFFSHPSGIVEQYMIDLSAYTAGVERILSLPTIFKSNILATSATPPNSSPDAVMSVRWISTAQVGVTSSRGIGAGAGVSIRVLGR